MTDEASIGQGLPKVEGKTALDTSRANERTYPFTSGSTIEVKRERIDRFGIGTGRASFEVLMKGKDTEARRRGEGGFWIDPSINVSVFLGPSRYDDRSNSVADLRYLSDFRGDTGFQPAAVFSSGREYDRADRAGRTDDNRDKYFRSGLSTENHIGLTAAVGKDRSGNWTVVYVRDGAGLKQPEQTSTGIAGTLKYGFARDRVKEMPVHRVTPEQLKTASETVDGTETLSADSPVTLTELQETFGIPPEVFTDGPEALTAWTQTLMDAPLPASISTMADAVARTK